MKQTPYWFAGYEADRRVKHIEYGADASAFDIAALLSETEEELYKLMHSNIAYDHISANDFLSRVEYLVEHDLNSLVSGIIRKLTESMIETSEGWVNIFAIASAEHLVPGKVEARKYGIEVWCLDTSFNSNAQ